jgi:ABC-type lipoprotein export system ATPase subunit
LLKDLNQKEGTTILLVTHNPEMAKYGNRHIIMENGRLIEEVLSEKLEVALEG